MVSPILPQLSRECAKKVSIHIHSINAFNSRRLNVHSSSLAFQRHVNITTATYYLSGAKALLFPSCGKHHDTHAAQLMFSPLQGGLEGEKEKLCCLCPTLDTVCHARTNHTLRDHVVEVSSF